MKRLLLSTLFTLFAVAAFAQKGTVTGTVVDADTGETVAGAVLEFAPAAAPDKKQYSTSGYKGAVSIPSLAYGEYKLVVSFLGYNSAETTFKVSAAKQDIGKIELRPGVQIETVVKEAKALRTSQKGDTVSYNAGAFKVTDDADVEGLLKKMPGITVSDGTVEAQGEQIKKVFVDGKEFFGGDVKTGLKNLPVDMIEKLKTYDKKSDLARITGIDDGEEETVLDLTVKKGMNQGWFGNADVAGGTEDRYMGRFMLNRFVDKTQVSVVGSANNVNDQGFSGGGGPPRWRRNNGLTATKMLGVNFATQTDKLELGGSARYNYQDGDIASIGSTEDFLPDGNSYSNSNSRQRNKAKNFNADFRMEWKPDSMTNIIFRPNFSYGKTDNLSNSESGTFSSDPYSLVSDPNNWLNLEKILNPDDDPLRSIRINAINSGSLNDNKSVSTDATLQLNRKLNDKGRNVTFRGRFGYTNNDNNQYTESETHYFQLLNALGGDSILVRNQYITTPTKNYNYSAQLTYSEPIARATFLQFSYQFQYKYSESDKTTYDLQGFPDWGLSTQLPTGYEEHAVDSLGKYAEYRYYNHDASVSLRFIREKYQLSAGMSFQPQHSVLSYKRGDYMIDTTRNVFNFAPNLDLRIRFSKVSQLRMTYRGRSSQPSMENLLPIVDNSNPQNVRIGNPGLKPSFTHNMRFFYNTYNAEKQRGIMSHVNFSATQNSISNSRVYNSETGGWTTTPKNINGNWNAFGMFGFNTALPNKKYTINSFSNANYQNNVAYLTSGKGADAVERKNTTTNLTLGERLNAAYRNDWFEFGLNGSISYSIEKDKLTPDNNQEPYTFSYGANTQISMPWNMTLSTNIANQSRRGYTDSSMNRNELIWNAQLSQTFLKGNATVSFEMYDILKKQSNISRSLTASGRSVYEYNGVNSYCMLHFIYRLNIFGSKAARDKMQGRRGFGGPGFGPGHGPGGFGGRRPF